MEKALAPFAPYAYAIMRIILGLLFVCHGGQKLFAGSAGSRFRSLLCSVWQE
jgi:uncharacterized membrane protein YphA (DoxX/SURF4 family)